ncbi:dTMP kinase [Embleya sp. NBC_00888]|uniref:dTMP kinase n=1 Tax=Embleya sp. NBC_00888 TaxID=2975960 RepID=UPI00386B8CA7|nr:dTMP kinase [Embleya sp. NBC_00888]
MTHAEQQAPDSAIPPRQVEPTEGIGGVLSIRPFRRFWFAVAASALGDWLALLALTSAALWTVEGDYREHATAVAVVFALRMLPAALVASVAGAIVDHLDRRWTLVTCDVIRALVLVSVPLVDEMWWVWGATAAVGVVGALAGPARDATVPNLVPRQRLGTANQFNLVTSYGAAPAAALLFILGALIGTAFSHDVSMFVEHPSNLACYTAGAVFLAASVFAFLIRMPTRGRSVSTRRPNPFKVLADGRKVFGHGRTARGLIVGMIALFLAGGALVATAPLLVVGLHAGNAAYGTVFLMLIAGVSAGMLWGPRVVPAFSRRRLYGVAVMFAGLTLLILAAVANVVVAAVLAAVLGVFAGVAWVTGYTMYGLDFGEDLRARAFAFAQLIVRIVLFVALVAAPIGAGYVGVRSWVIADRFTFDYSGAALILAGTGAFVVILGWIALLSVDDRRGVPILRDLAAATRNEDHITGRPAGATGFFIALEGGEGAGKSTQANAIAAWIRAKGHEVVVTREPGATEVGKRLRAMLLDLDGAPIDPRTEALLYAADRAEHVQTVILPALRRGAIVISDRYIDSSIAYQGAGRGLGAREIGRVSRWAGDGLLPDLTILLDLDPAVGHGRFTEAPDRLESEPREFHLRVRHAFLDLAAHDPDRYLVVDADQEPDAVTTPIRHRLDRELPLSEQEKRQALELAKRMREEDARRKAEQAARDAEKAALIARLRAESEERQRQAEQARLEEESARLAEEEQRYAEEEARRIAAEADERARTAAEAAEEARLHAEAERRRLAAEAERRAQEQQRVAEEAKARAEEARVRAEEEAERRDEQRRRLEEASALQAEQARASAEEEREAALERQRLAEEERDRLQAEAARDVERMRAEEAVRVADERRATEERRRAEDALRRAEADRRRAEREASRAAEAAASARTRAAQEAAALAAEAGPSTDADMVETPVHGIRRPDPALGETPVHGVPKVSADDADTTELRQIKLREAAEDTREIPKLNLDETHALPVLPPPAAPGDHSLADDLLGPWTGDPAADEAGADADADDEPAEPERKRRWRRNKS